MRPLDPACDACPHATRRRWWPWRLCALLDPGAAALGLQARIRDWTRGARRHRCPGRGA